MKPIAECHVRIINKAHKIDILYATLPALPYTMFPYMEV
jgi:hypothetical protein